MATEDTFCETVLLSLFFSDGRPLFCNGHIDVTKCYKYDPKRDEWRHFGDTLYTG